jgi:hypothetical protein
VAAPNRGLATGGFAWGNIKELKFLFYIKKPISWIFQTSGVADLQSTVEKFQESEFKNYSQLRSKAILFQDYVWVRKPVGYR